MLQHQSQPDFGEADNVYNVGSINGDDCGNYEYGDIQSGNESWSSQGYALHPCAVQENLAKAEIQMKTSNLLESNKSLLRSLNTTSRRFQISAQSNRFP